MRQVARHQTYGSYLPLVASILEREPPLFGCARPTGDASDPTWLIELRNDLSLFLDVADATDYVRRVLISIGANEPANAQSSSTRRCAYRRDRLSRRRLAGSNE